jgi:hypothetical protein
MTKEEKKMAAKNTDSEWETVDEGSRLRIAFDSIGDTFEGIYEGEETVTFPDGESGQYLNFRGVEPDAIAGETCAISATYQLARTFTAIPKGAHCRIIFRSETPLRQGNPLKNFLVQVRK